MVPLRDEVPFTCNVVTNLEEALKRYVLGCYVLVGGDFEVVVLICVVGMVFCRSCEGVEEKILWTV